MKYTLLIFIVVFTLTGCVQTLELSPLPDKEQHILYSNGANGITSTKKHIVLVGTMSQFTTAERLRFIVHVENLGNSAFVFSTENITVEDDKGKELKIFTYDELAAEKRKEAAMIGVIHALNAAAQGLNAGYTQSYGSYSGYGGGGTYQAYSYDSSSALLAQSAANAQAQSQISDIKQKLDTNISYLQKSTLKKQTILASKNYGGTIYVAMPDSQSREGKITVYVELDGEKYQFQFNSRIAK